MVTILRPASQAAMMTLARGLLRRAGVPACQEGADRVAHMAAQVRAGTLDPDRAATEACRLARSLLAAHQPNGVPR